MSERPGAGETTSDFVDGTVNEHRRCLGLVSSLEDCLDRRPDDPQRWLADLRKQLSALPEVLRCHFASEESGPIFRQLPTRHPRLAAGLAQLESEHPAILDELRRAVRRADELERPEVFELRELNARVQLFVARLRRHEAAENELVFQAYWDEIGVGD